jgi:hypothetical protein
LTPSCRFRRPANSSGSATRDGFRARALYTLVAGACVGLGSATAAAAPQVPTRLVWDGSVCGNAADFAVRVRQRTSAVRFVQRGQRISVRLRIEQSASGLDASVSIEARGRAPLRRHIESPDCEDALDALALVVAIGVEGRSDPTAGAPPRRRPRGGPRPLSPESTLPPVSEASPDPAAPPSAVSPAAAPAELPAPAPMSPPPDAATPEVPSAPPPAVAPPAPLTASPSSEPPRATARVAPVSSEPEVDAPERLGTSGPRPFHVGAGLSAQMSLGVAPQPLIGGALWVATGYDGEGVWSPELLVGATHQRLDGLTRASGEVDFALNAGGLSFCPVRLGSPTLQVRPCGAVVIGQLSTHAHETYDARSRDRPWRTLGGSIELLSVVGVVELRAAIGAAAPLIRDEFQFGLVCSGPACEADVFHRVAPVIWSGAAGAGIRFW